MSGRRSRTGVGWRVGDTIATTVVPGQWRIMLDGMPANDNERRRWHWTRRHTEDTSWKAAVVYACKELGIPAMQRVRLSAVVFRRALWVADESNDRARLKPLEDGLVLAGVVPNDTRGHVEWGSVTEARGKPGVVLVVEALGGAEGAPG